MSQREECMIKQEWQEMSSNKPVLEVLLEADSVDQEVKVSLASRVSTISLGNQEVKAEEVILSVIFSKNSRNSSVVEEDKQEVHLEKHNNRQKAKILW